MEHTQSKSEQLICTTTAQLPTDELFSLLETGHSLTLQVKQIYETLNLIRACIISRAEAANPYRRKTVKLNAGHFEAVILFKDDTTYAPQLIPEIRKLLGEDEYQRLFREKTEYRGNFQPLKSFLSSVTTDKLEIAAKKLISRAEIKEILMPYVKFSIKQEGESTHA